MNINSELEPLTVYSYKIQSKKLDSLIRYVLSLIPDGNLEEFPSFSVFEAYSKWGAHYKPGGKGDGTIYCDPILASESMDVAIGTLAHEFSHLFLRHPDKGGLEDEEQADILASTWGFKKEIRALRKNLGPPTKG